MGTTTAVQNGRGRLVTTIAIGVIAYIAAVLLHEAVGHGGVCIATGGHITMLDPLGMRCSIVQPVMVAAGPVMNLLAGMLCWIGLRSATAWPANARYFLWFSMMFNLLIAAGYMAVCGVMNFGDWAVLIGGREPAVAWRAGLIGLAIALYYLFLRLLAIEYYRLAGPPGFDGSRLRAFALFPTIAAAIVACAAAALSPTDRVLAFELSVGTTVVVGLTLLRLPDIIRHVRKKPVTAPDHIAFSPIWIGCALVASVLFIVFIGPGFVSHQ
jgi:hypothetical protein